jgi:hypothetical protein
MINMDIKDYNKVEVVVVVLDLDFLEIVDSKTSDLIVIILYKFRNFY